MVQIMHYWCTCSLSFVSDRTNVCYYKARLDSGLYTAYHAQVRCRVELTFDKMIIKTVNETYHTAKQKYTYKIIILTELYFIKSDKIG